MNSIVKKPWGSFEILDQGDNFTLKKLRVIPGGKLSLQRHKHRSEHWIIAQGIAEITLDDKLSILKENQRIFIPKGSKHRIHNKGDQELIIIELWYGHILDENDIERFDDIYNRNN
tara:strand:- start:1 stop:348 length:348 start_codon:yes stop_codon:yes gene_type:complete